jgi:hypothetical protein
LKGFLVKVTLEEWLGEVEQRKQAEHRDSQGDNQKPLVGFRGRQNGTASVDLGV